MKKNLALLFVVLSTSLAWGLEPWQGEDHEVESWRCGAPLVESLRKSDPDALLNDPAGKLKLKESLEKISLNNLEYMRKRLGTLTDEEEALIKAMQTRYQAPIVHRTDLEISRLVLTNDAGMVSATKRHAAARITPDIEEQLFSGRDCIFTSVAPPYGTETYGSVIFRFKDKNEFAWGSMLTGFTWTREVMGRSVTDPATSTMKQKFARMVFTNNDWDEALALQVIDHVRKGSSIRGKGEPYNKATIISDLLKAYNNDYFWKKVTLHRLAYFEGHYTDSVYSKSFSFVQFRDMDMATVKSWNFPKNWFEADPEAFIQWFKRAL